MENYKIYYYSCDIPKLDMREVYRYMGGGEDISGLVIEQAEIILSNSTPKAVYMIAPVECACDEVDFGLFKCKSKALVKSLEGCSKAVIFGATIGFGADREIMKYSAVSPSKALGAQAIGTAIVETLCDNLCKYIINNCKVSLKPRFSPGYLDLELNTQKNIFEVLNLPKNCGVSLTESLIMRPSKSVTAIAGIIDSKAETCKKSTKCSMCDKSDCMYRKDK